jgi:lipopolysaccharide biosynthesis glycosyltransferase
MFQYHKFYIFDLYFKNWDSVLYIDCGMHIYNPIHRILDINVDKLFYAHSDSYPAYIRKLDSQFINSNSIYDNLKNDYDLTTKDYFQSGVVYFDTHIIKENIVRDLMELVNKYPIGNGDQAFMNLYFIDIWKPLPVKDNSGFLYDYWERDNNKSSDYVMLKYPKT